ncbi:glycosyltransferase family 2 protein [Nitrospirillum amazonense]|uniref:Cellulose synthase (UDP-forming) n=1 Tax=Nitrospirillum amazonense TaxID=28077 RepID=A0A560K9N3_9PROT|nr:cellulose synthase catalytic subunit [Nitrospirillum amazonense]MDG3441463.1 cellulose synthase catalytic subunit [Nitrospirillum amazonense]TWB80043.1 cellulose synthase (UDP-forming) [Nitrospirillum amazonense]
MGFYFDRFESRRPPPPIPYSAAREFLWQVLGTANLVVGLWYLHWRWTQSLNPDALWFAIPLAAAETMAFLGLVLFTVNLWRTEDPPRPPPPARIADCVEETDVPDRPVSVDVFFATYNEDPELVRLGLREARAMTYPHPIDLAVHVLDDGRRPEMRRVAEEEGCNYITRTNNIGFKAGNLRNAMEQTSGDFIVICDADTRPFPTMIEHTLGYFRDPTVAWVQTPHWFYDLPEGRRLPVAWGRRLGAAGRFLGRCVEAVAGPIHVGRDPFVNDSQMFFDVLQRRRNWANASFCCGASSIHRRDAVMQAALKSYTREVARNVDARAREALKLTGESTLDAGLEAALVQEAALAEELTPYKFHVSEDIYTSIVLHSDSERRWRSVLHPEVETRMLSPQDLLSWSIQRFKYAGGSLDILFHDNPLLRGELTIWQKLMYAATFYSYLGALWNVVFFAAPIIYLTTGVAPVRTYSFDFFKHIIPFLMLNELAFMIGSWGVPGYQGKRSWLSFFPINLRALWSVLRHQQIKFPVTPKDRQEGNFLRLVRWQLLVMVLSVAGLAYAGIRLWLGDSPFSWGGLLANVFWCANNIFALSGIVSAAFWSPDDDAPADAAAEGVPA